MPERHGRHLSRRSVLAVLVAAFVLAGCSAILESSPEPTPMDFPGIAGELANRGLVLDAIVSGDDGCDDPSLAPTAIAFDATGLGIATGYDKQIRGTNVATRNASDAISKAQTNDGYGAQITENLQRLYEIAVQLGGTAVGAETKTFGQGGRLRVTGPIAELTNVRG